jgi:inner membrane protein
MDPLSQAVVGAAVTQSVAPKQHLGTITLLGALAGMAPDLDVLIRSSTDPLLFLEYHRQFTHSFFFIPFGGLICALAFWPFAKRCLSFRHTYFVTTLGYATHGLLDACTTYGTLLFWPFSLERIAWNTIAVIDPLFTIPLLTFVVAALIRRSVVWSRIGLFVALCYLGLGYIQRERAESVGETLALGRDHREVSVSAKPTLGNLLLWKVIYQYEGRFWVDAVRVGSQPLVYSGGSVAVLDIPGQFPWLKEGSQQAKDLARFDWFSSGHLAVDNNDSFRVIDMRYSMLPNEIDGLWGIRLTESAASDQHVTYEVKRSVDKTRVDNLIAMLAGQANASISGAAAD